MSAISMRPVAVRAASSARVQKAGFAGSVAPLAMKPVSRQAIRTVVRAEDKAQVIQPLNGDPFIGMLETPVTSSPLVAGFLSNLPAYRTGVSPVLRGVEVGLAHGLIVCGPFTKLGPLRDIEGVAETAGALSGAGLVMILALCLTIYGQSTFQSDAPALGKKTLTGRALATDPLQTSEGWSGFSSGFLVGGLAG